MTNTVKTNRELNGNSFEVTFEKGYWIEKLNSDGWEVGEEKHIINNLIVKVNGKKYGTAIPTAIDTNDIWFKGQREKAYKNGAKYEIKNGGCFGAYLSETAAKLIIEMIEEVEEMMVAELNEEIANVVTELETIETEKKVQAEKNFKEIADIGARDRKSGLCPKCGSYCYGDCEAN